MIAHNSGQMHKTLWTDLGQGDQIVVRELDDEHAEARYVAGEIERLVDEGVSRSEIAVLLPDERAVARAGGHARPARDRLPGDRRHEVLRARRDQGRDRLPHAARQPAGRGELPARRQQPAARDRPDLALTRADARLDASASASGTPRPSPRRCRVSGPRRSSRSAASWTRWRACARAPSQKVPIGDLLEAVIHESGYVDCARGRAHDRGAGPAREPAGARRGRARVRRPRARGRGHARRLPAAGRARRRRRLARGRRRPRHADDAAQREGPRVPGRLHDRDGGGDLSRTRARWTRGTSRRSGASVTSASPARCATSR